MEIILIAIIGIFGLIIFSSGEDTSKKSDSDDENFHRDDEASTFSLSDDDFSSTHFINPASGAPMIDEGTCGIDTLGNSYGNDDIFENTDTHSEF
jgi:hypothetical protein